MHLQLGRRECPCRSIKNNHGEERRKDTLQGREGQAEEQEGSESYANHQAFYCGGGAAAASGDETDQSER